MRFGPVASAMLSIAVASGAYAAEPLKDLPKGVAEQRYAPDTLRDGRDRMRTISYRPRSGDPPETLRFGIDVIDQVINGLELDRYLDMGRHDRRMAEYEQNLLLTPPIDPRRSSLGVQFYIPERGDRMERDAMRIGAAALDYLIRRGTEINSENVRLRARGAPGGAKLVLTVWF